MNNHASELAGGERFAFGENWTKYLSTLNSDRIETAIESLRELLAIRDLQGKTFLDVGSGSGLFSLSARSLEATVRSFDYDPASVACTHALKLQHYDNDKKWIVDEASILDRNYLANLGTFDVVYSWGVLHHTGAMWEALENVASLVAHGGQLCLAIYNDQGRASKFWRRVKRAYCGSSEPVRQFIVLAALLRLWGPTTLRDLLRGKAGATWRQYRFNEARGMSPWRDVIDWVGGYPFEVAKPEEIFEFFRQRGFALGRLKTCGGGLGCNEYVFTRVQLGQNQRHLAAQAL